MSAFAAMADALFRDPNLATSATYSPASGEPKSVRLILSSPDASTDVFGAGIISDTITASVRISEISEAAVGDTFLVNGISYRVAAPPTRDPLRLIAAMALEEL